MYANSVDFARFSCLNFPTIFTSQIVVIHTSLKSSHDYACYCLLLRTRNFILKGTLADRQGRFYNSPFLAACNHKNHLRSRMAAQLLRSFLISIVKITRFCTLGLDVERLALILQQRRFGNGKPTSTA